MSFPQVPLFGTGLRCQRILSEYQDLHPILDDRMRLGCCPPLVQDTLEQTYLIFYGKGLKAHYGCIDTVEHAIPAS